MSDPLLDYSSWSFQLILVLAVLYLVVGLIQPSWVLATKRSTIVAVFIVVALLSSTAFYLVARSLPGGDDTPAQINAEPSPPLPAQP